MSVSMVEVECKIPYLSEIQSKELMGNSVNRGICERVNDEKERDVGQRESA